MASPKHVNPVVPGIQYEVMCKDDAEIGPSWKVRTSTEASRTNPGMYPYDYHLVHRTPKGRYGAVWLDSDGIAPREDYFGKDWRLDDDSPILRELIAAVEKYESENPVTS